MVHLVPSRVRAARPGRIDGTSQRGVYVVRWEDEDGNKRESQVEAESSEDALCQMASRADTSSLLVFGPVPRPA